MQFIEKSKDKRQTRTINLFLGASTAFLLFGGACTEPPVTEPSDPTLARNFPRWSLPVDVSADNYQDNNDGTVTDKTTGLIWEKTIATTTFDNENAVAYCNGLALAGREDWRLPSRAELASLTNYKQKNPASTFPDMLGDAFWSSTLVKDDNDSGWFINFSLGLIETRDLAIDFRVRCVHADANQTNDAPSSQYTVTNETVTDNFTGLVWQREIPDQIFTQAQAIAFCDGLVFAGASDWRLPHVQELLSIIDDTQSDPMIDPTAFPNTPNDVFCSITSVSEDIFGGWFVDFSNGTNVRGLTDSSILTTLTQGRARCVR